MGRIQTASKTRSHKKSSRAARAKPAPWAPQVFLLDGFRELSPSEAEQRARSQPGDDTGRWYTPVEEPSTLRRQGRQRSSNPYRPVARMRAPDSDASIRRLTIQASADPIPAGNMQDIEETTMNLVGAHFHFKGFGNLGLPSNLEDDLSRMNIENFPHTSDRSSYNFDEIPSTFAEGLAMLFGDTSTAIDAQTSPTLPAVHDPNPTSRGLLASFNLEGLLIRDEALPMNGTDRATGISADPAAPASSDMGVTDIGGSSTSLDVGGGFDASELATTSLEHEGQPLTNDAFWANLVNDINLAWDRLPYGPEDIINMALAQAELGAIELEGEMHEVTDEGLF
ncbi:unnamed protein product [Peniophora sp. CBMAI 1063]|nr:unnamed protein product [Peniophora sp. CBMAI 1063]